MDAEVFYNTPTWILDMSPSDLQLGLTLLIPSCLCLEDPPINLKCQKCSLHYGLWPEDT